MRLRLLLRSHERVKRLFPFFALIIKFLLLDRHETVEDLTDNQSMQSIRGDVEYFSQLIQLANLILVLSFSIRSSGDPDLLPVALGMDQSLEPNL